MKPIKIMTKEYGQFLSEIKSRIVAARIHAARAVNKELLGLYWDIGKIIVARQKQYGWGQSIVEKLADDLTVEFKGTHGFSVQNLWRMRLLYLAYKDSPKLAQLVREIPWGQNIVILQMVKDDQEREYYIRKTAEMGWSRNVLLNQIKAGAYQCQKTIPKQHNFPKALPKHLAEQAGESLKSVYNLDFLDIAEPVLERELERKLIEKIKQFMLELGHGFSFIGNQYRLELDDTEYFVDLLFFNRKLRCLVAVELKTGKFLPEYAGKMDFYLNLLNDQTRFNDENPSIGIIFCADKSKITVEYALSSIKNPVGVVQYYLTPKMPAELKNILPAEKEIRNRLIGEMK